MTEHRLFPYFLILAAGAIWGLVFSLTLIATAQGAHPLGLSAWQVVLTAAFFGVVCLVSKITLFNFKNLRHYVLIGITVPNLLYYNAAPHLSAGILSITVSTVPLFTYAMMLMLRFESVVARRLSGIGVGMIAILLLVVPDQGLSSNDASFWILLVLLCAILYAFENVYISKGIARHTDVRELLFSSNLVAAVIQFPLAIYLGVDESWTWLASDAGLAIAGIAIGSSLAYAMFFYTIKISGPVFASQCAYAVTISGVIWGIMIFSEQHSIWVWLSVIVMLLGLMLVNPDDEAEVTDVGKSANVEKSI
jgi:drug/metabolite transporter (DMT)-like permease